MAVHPIPAEVVERIECETGEPSTIETCRSVSGGCINQAWVVSTTSGMEFFIKSNPDCSEAVFATEANGLNAMNATETIRVPAVITFGQLSSGPAFLVLEAISSHTRAGNFYETFGRQLAEMHRRGRSAQFGFDSDNWLGASLQMNPRRDDWRTFWVEARLIPQLKMAQDNGVSSQKLQQLGQALISRIDRFINDDGEPPALIHGDLWSGNYLSDENGQPVILDPACYYANREAEFGMTKLFGGFPPQFYDAYQEAWPLTDGWETRTELYTLYHLLNHLNLFGTSYLGGCLEILQRYA